MATTSGPQLTACRACWCRCQLLLAGIRRATRGFRRLPLAEQPLFKLCPGATPLRERAEDLLQHCQLPIERRQLGLQRLDAAPLRGDALSDRLQLRRRQGTRQRERARHRRQPRTGSGQALQPAGDGAQLSNELLGQAGNTPDVSCSSSAIN